MSTMTMPETETFAVGDEVTIDHPRFRGQVFVIKQIKITKAIVKPKGQPNARGVDAPLSMLTKYDPNAPAAPVVTTIPIITTRIGEVVRLKRAYRDNTTETLMVVTNVNRTSISLDPLGGVNGTPMRIGAESVVKVNLADILA